MYLLRLRRSIGALSVLLLSLAAHVPADAQEPYRIQGSVVDAATQRPVPGAQVAIVGTSIGSITDANGNYTIIANVSAGTYTINVTFIGRESASAEVQLAGQAAVRVPTLALRETALELEELIVTGTATPTSRRALGNSVSSIDASDIEDTPATTIDQALQGKVSGALITSNTGTPGGGVSIRLRGTSSITGGAEPLYIVDGVIIDNNADQQINVGYRSNPINRLADLDPDDIERVEVLKGAAAAALFGSRANNGVVQIFTKRGRAGAMQMTASSRVSRSDLPRRIDFAMTPVDLTGNTVERFDPQDLVFRDGLGSDTHVSVSGGADQTRFYLSASYLDQEGIMIGSAHDKLNTRLNLDQGFSDWFSVSAGANYVRSNSDLVISGEQGEGGLLTAIVFTPTTVDFSEINPETGDYVIQQTTFPNPLVVVRDWQLPQAVSRFVGSFQARATPITDLSLEYRLGYDTYQMETRQSIPRESAWTPDGRVTSANRGNILVNNDIVGNVNWAPADAIRMTTSGGFNHTYQRVDQLNASARDITPLTELVRGAVQSASQARTELTTVGFFGQQQAAIADRLFLTGALRMDASSTFGADERWQMYPKLSASYVVSEEPAFQNFGLDWLNEFRLRGALGYAGNQPPLGSAYARISRYGTAINVDRLGLVPLSAAGNPELKPERQREYELGFDVSAISDRVGLSFTYYDQVTEDLLLSRVFAPSSGVGSVLDNVGKLSNTGLEVELNTINFTGRNFGWNSTLIYSRNENEIVELEGDPFYVGYGNRVEEGLPLGMLYLPAYQRDSAGNIVFEAEGLPAVSPGRDIVGNPWPEFSASMRNEFSIGEHLTASFLLDGQFGHELWNQTARIMDIFGAGPLYDQLLRGEITQTQRARIQSIWESYVEDASFVKLRDASLRYSVPNRFAQRLGASGMQLELLGRNLYTWTDYSGYDPEINMFGLLTVERGVDFAVYPNAREVSFGIRLNY
jgi:TonB-dependent SusC/RagA subfamily outer membrane receptor